MKTLLWTILISIIITVTCWTIGYFIIGLQLLLSPLLLIIGLVGFIGLITLPIGVYKLYKKQNLNKRLIIFIGISIGFFLGMIVQRPIDNWDEKQRNLGGKIISSELDSFRRLNGQYPVSLSQLDTTLIKSKLSKTYPLGRFNYELNDSGYNLYIIIPIMDRWIWNSEINEFLYQDF